MKFWEIFNFTTTILLSACAFFIFIYFLNKLLKTRKKSKELLPFLGITIVFIFFSISFFIAAWFDYYHWEYGIIYVGLYKLHFSLFIISLVVLAFLTDYSSRGTKYFLTIYSIFCLIITLILNDFEQLKLYPNFLALPAIFLLTLMWYFTFLKPTSGFLRRRMIFALIGVYIVIIGLLGRNEDISDLIGPYIYSIGTLMTIVGLSLIGYGFFAFSTFTDIKWKDKLRELFVIADNGVCLYAYSFEKNVSVEDSDLIAGGFSGIETLLSEIVKTKETMQLIDYKNAKIMINHESIAMFVLIIKEESSFLRYKLKVFSEEFKKFFEDIFQHWMGKIAYFKPTRTIIQRVFELDIN
jgi:hypothetical protein